MMGPIDALTISAHENTPFLPALETKTWVRGFTRAQIVCTLALRASSAARLATEHGKRRAGQINSLIID